VSTSDDDEQLESANNTATLFHKVVPPKNTERHQPIDVGFMLQYRFFLKKVMDKQRQVSQRDPSQPKQHQLSFTIQLHSILTNQFGADAFSQLLKYCFFAAGYSVPNYDENVGFLDVVQVCFSFQKGWCEVADCNNLRFVQCAHCRKCICMHHFCSTMFASTWIRLRTWAVFWNSKLDMLEKFLEKDVKKSKRKSIKSKKP